MSNESPTFPVMSSWEKNDFQYIQQSIIPPVEGCFSRVISTIWLKVSIFFQHTVLIPPSI